MGESCVPNLMILPFADLIQWCNLRQKHLKWTNQQLADKSRVPLSTITRIKAGDYADCKYSTIRSILIALIGGTEDEFPCNEQVDRELKQAERELKQMEALEQQATKLSAVEQENEALKSRLAHLDEQHRSDIRAVQAEYREQIADYQEHVAFLKDELKAWRTLHQR
jgi:vacuolar-type H+-ATPase subunit I/STV1